MSSTNPTIGVFDSGFGGLTVLRAMLPRIPGARWLYLGDTARLPYGAKSKQTVARYAVSAIEYLQGQGADFLVIACNTASALALDEIRAAARVPVLGVIETGVAAAVAASRGRNVIVLGTAATIASHAYARACSAAGLRVTEKACPLLVPLVEEGWAQHEITGQVVRIYLEEAFKAAAMTEEMKAPRQAEEMKAPRQAEEMKALRQARVSDPRISSQEEAGALAPEAAETEAPDTVLLGCTHYPLLREVFARHVPAGVTLVDSAEVTAVRAAELIGFSIQAAAAESPLPVPKFFVTDSTAQFQSLGERFLGQPIANVRHVELPE